jgi:hypothetical protein
MLGMGAMLTLRKDAAIAWTPDGLRLEGPIQASTFLGFTLRLGLAVLVDLDGHTVIELDSSGGNLDAALKMASVIEALQALARIDTRVPEGASCQSACTVLFAAGRSREAAKDALFMFHAASFTGGSADPARARQLQGRLETRYLLALERADPSLLRRLKREGAFDRLTPTFLRAQELGRGEGAFVTAFLPADP